MTCQLAAKLEEKNVSYVSCTPDTQSNTSVSNVLNACKNHTGWNRIGKPPNLQFMKHTCDLETRSRSSTLV